MFGVLGFSITNRYKGVGWCLILAKIEIHNIVPKRQSKHFYKRLYRSEICDSEPLADLRGESPRDPPLPKFCDTLYK